MVMAATADGQRGELREAPSQRFDCRMPTRRRRLTRARVKKSDSHAAKIPHTQVTALPLRLDTSGAGSSGSRPVSVEA